MSTLHARGLRYRKNVSSLPGKPDVVFRLAKVVVFVDGRFWHGWKFAEWRDKLAPYWREKIDRNRRRDTQVARKLRRQGWSVVRVWEHELDSDAERCVERIVKTLRRPRGAQGQGGGAS